MANAPLAAKSVVFCKIQNHYSTILFLGKVLKKELPKESDKISQILYKLDVFSGVEIWYNTLNYAIKQGTR